MGMACQISCKISDNYFEWRSCFKHLTVLIILICLQKSVHAQVKVERKRIIGVWISDEDKKWRIEFKTNGECIWIYQGTKTIDTFIYRITDSMPICSLETSPIDPSEKVTFLELVDKKDGMKLCYEINGVSDKTLSITELEGGGYLLFNRAIRKPSR